MKIELGHKSFVESAILVRARTGVSIDTFTMALKSSIFILIFITVRCVNSQSFNVDSGGGTGIAPIGGSLLWPCLSAGIGHSFNDMDFLYGGFKSEFYKINWNPSEYSHETEFIMSSAIFTGYRYLFPIGVLHKGSTKGRKKEKKVGIFPEGRFYFSPLLPKRMAFYDSYQDETIVIKGDYKMQAGYGLALGVFFEPYEAYSYYAIKIEYNNLDMFEVLRTMEFPDVDNLPGKGQIIVSLSIFSW